MEDLFNIKANLTDEIDRGFTEIYNTGKLIHGSGIFRFKDFSINI